MKFYVYVASYFVKDYLNATSVEDKARILTLSTSESLGGGFVRVGEAEVAITLEKGVDVLAGVKAERDELIGKLSALSEKIAELEAK